MMRDLQAHGVDDHVKLAQLSGATLIGSWPSREDAKNMYMCDWRASDLAKKMNKAKIPGLFGCKSFLDLSEYFSMLVTLLSSVGENAFALRVNQFFTESVASLGTDFKALFAMIVHYLTRTFVGRGFPVTLSPELIVRFKGGDASDMQKKLDESERSVAVMKQILKDMQTEQRETKKSIERLQRTRSRTEQSKKEGKQPMKCFRCGGAHMVKDCTEPDERDVGGASGVAEDSD